MENSKERNYLDTVGETKKVKNTESINGLLIYNANTGCIGECYEGLRLRKNTKDDYQFYYSVKNIRYTSHYKNTKPEKIKDKLPVTSNWWISDKTDSIYFLKTGVSDIINEGDVNNKFLIDYPLTNAMNYLARILMNECVNK